MSQERQERIDDIANRTWIRHFSDRLGISDAELLRYEGVEEHSLPAKEQLLSDRPEQIDDATIEEYLS